MKNTTRNITRTSSSCKSQNVPTDDYTISFHFTFKLYPPFFFFCLTAFVKKKIHPFLYNHIVYLKLSIHAIDRHDRHHYRIRLHVRKMTAWVFLVQGAGIPTEWAVTSKGLSTSNPLSNTLEWAFDSK